ncbi:hypothetical protein ACHAWF_000515, partial [Thalassiosira exigua]
MRACEIQVDESDAPDGILLVRVRPYIIIAIGVVFTLGSSAGFVGCFAPFDRVPYDKTCLDDDGRSAFLPLVITFFAGLMVLFCFASWDDFSFDRNAGVLQITRR